MQSTMRLLWRLLRHQKLGERELNGKHTWSYWELSNGSLFMRAWNRFAKEHWVGAFITKDTIFFKAMFLS